MPKENMKEPFVKYLIKFRANQKKLRFILMILTIAAIITSLWRNILFQICLICFVTFLVYMLVLSIVCVVHRKKYQRIKVYLSFSVRRIPEMVKYIDKYLKSTFWVFNIDYYDFREHKQFHFLDEYAICAEIDKNLTDSDTFIRFIDYGLEPNKMRSVKDKLNDIIFNPFTREITGKPDYTEYEVDISFDKFDFNNPNNRFQIAPFGFMATPMKHIKHISIDLENTDLDFALKVIYKISQGYQEQQYRKRSDLFWTMRDQMMSDSEGE